MADICGDNRFEIIKKAKAELLESTNIETSEDEMKVHHLKTQMSGKQWGGNSPLILKL